MDVILQRSEGGVDSALVYAKSISKYMKDLITYVEKRTTLGKWKYLKLRLSEDKCPAWKFKEQKRLVFLFSGYLEVTVSCESISQGTLQ